MFHSEFMWNNNNFNWWEDVFVSTTGWNQMKAGHFRVVWFSLWVCFPLYSFPVNPAAERSCWNWGMLWNANVCGLLRGKITLIMCGGMERMVVIECGKSMWIDREIVLLRQGAGFRAVGFMAWSANVYTARILGRGGGANICLSKKKKDSTKEHWSCRGQRDGVAVKEHVKSLLPISIIYFRDKM